MLSSLTILLMSFALPAVAQNQSQPSLPPASFKWTTFVDPSEHSFEVEVPAGWQAEGGLTRVGAIDTRPWVRVTAPDNSVAAFIGDGTISPGTLPTATLTATRYGVGRQYGTAVIMPYLPAPKFLEKYIAIKLKPAVKDLQFVDAESHPDFARTVNGSVGVSRSDGASTKFTCLVRGEPAVGCYLATTKESLQANSGMWWVTYIAGELSRTDKEVIGLQVLTHMMQTFHLDPQWQSSSLKLTAAVSANYQAAANAMSQSIVSRYWDRQAANDSFNRNWEKNQAVMDRTATNYSDMMRGQQTVIDRTSGSTYKVDYNSAKHWINPSGTITGTDGTSPGMEWRPLDPVK